MAVEVFPYEHSWVAVTGAGAAQWALAWMKDPEAGARAPVPHRETLEVWARPDYRG